MTIKLLETTAVDLSEKEIQQAFEKRLDLIEPGLQHIGSFIAIGNGIIDTLCIDSEDNAVIIEFKRPGDFDKDALVQLMSYYSWFARDENHVSLLTEIIRSKKSEFQSVEDIRLIAVVSEIEENVKNACYALEPSTKLITYSVIKEANGDFGIVPTVILNTEEREPTVGRPRTESDHLERNENLKDLYFELKKTIMASSSDITFNPQPKGYIAFIGKRNFAIVKFLKSPALIRLELFLREAGMNNDRLKPATYPGWYFLTVDSKSQIDQLLKSWIVLAFQEQSK